MCHHSSHKGNSKFNHITFQFPFQDISREAELPRKFVNSYVSSSFCQHENDLFNLRQLVMFVGIIVFKVFLSSFHKVIVSVKIWEL